MPSVVIIHHWKKVYKQGKEKTPLLSSNKNYEHAHNEISQVIIKKKQKNKILIPKKGTEIIDHICTNSKCRKNRLIILSPKLNLME